MLTRYVWQAPDWPRFRWDQGSLAGPLSRARLAQGRVLGKVAALGFDLHLAQRARVLVEEALRTAAIEGDVLDPEAVRSSVARRLGLPEGGGRAVPLHVDGLVEVLLDATAGSSLPLSAERLKAWHAALFPTGWSNLRRILVGEYRAPGAAMQVVSGAFGHERVHFEAPPAERVPSEVKAFLEWFERRGDGEDGLLRVGVAHFWLVTIHPFEDGNGRLARAVGEMALARDDGQMERFYSLSAQIEAERESYYSALEQAQTGDGDLTGWLEWFLACVERAAASSEAQVDLALAQARFWQEHAGKPLNERQLKLVRRALEAGPGGFEGGLTTRKAAHLTRVSPATAQRDLADLLAKGVIVRGEPGGRSTAYRLASYELRMA
jgi:Fic family protein